MSRKTLTKAAAERDEAVRAAWEGIMAKYTDPDVFIALDESAVDSRTAQRLMVGLRLESSVSEE